MLYQTTLLLLFLASTVHGAPTSKPQGVVSPDDDKLESLMAKIDAATFTADEKLLASLC